MGVMHGPRRELETHGAWEALLAALHGERPLHVTALAAACLRVVDAAALNELLSSRDQCGRFRRIRDDANRTLATAGGAKSTVYPDTLAALAGSLRRYDIADDAAPDERSLGARALAQALHESRESHVWSYFSDWTEPRKLSAGDPVPVPSSPKLYEIYRRPLRLSPCPDTRDTPHGLCPGGYRGLPSLRLAPACSEGDLYLDPLLGHDLCPLATDNTASGAAAIVVPAEDLDQRYEYTPVSLDDGERVFHRVRPRGSTGDVGRLIDGIIANLERAGDHAALAVLPELTSTPALEDAIGEALASGSLGHLQLIVAGSAWISGDAADGLGDNRSTTLPQRGERRHHYKFSWFHHKVAGAEHLAHRRKRITILAGPRITLTTLVCKDALETWVPGVLQELRVRLVVVPSCNPGVAAFRPFAWSVADLGWGTVVLANIPPDAGAPPEYVLVVRPAARVTPGETGRVSELLGPGEYNSLIFLEITSPDSFS
jgi:hypothetical protein